MTNKRNRKTRDKPCTWIIHLVSDGLCEKCGRPLGMFIPYACNAHSHGMEQYGHLDFQMVVMFGSDVIGYAINTLCARVRDGERFVDGQIVNNLYENCPARIQEFEETGRKVLRIIVPDKDGRWPEDINCDEVFKIQMFATDALMQGTGPPS